MPGYVPVPPRALFEAEIQAEYERLSQSADELEEAGRTSRAMERRRYATERLDAKRELLRQVYETVLHG